MAFVCRCDFLESILSHGLGDSFSICSRCMNGANATPRLTRGRLVPGPTRVSTPHYGNTTLKRSRRLIQLQSLLSASRLTIPSSAATSAPIIRTTSISHTVKTTRALKMAHINRLSAFKIKQALKPGMYADGPGLYLQFRPGMIQTHH